ncbi:MAG: type I-U CRISPR-associated protein Cas5/Cas6 [Alicyclobacillaceae bacterium]|nr:type I-U CRISPR-associated protein Cas5/Cas6 [Alicyclobacillaceae bacterium]
MIGMEFRFPAGTYHATPWGRHVNEAEVEWPPSPWRLLRALIASWHRYGVFEEYPQDLLRDTIHLLATEAPVYALPDAVHAHSRHYMPTSNSTTLVFDGFLRLEEAAVLGVYWSNLTASDEQLKLLQRIVEHMGYLGRAESWVQGEVVTWSDREVNCGPLGTPVAERLQETPEAEAVQLLVPQPPQLYAEWVAVQSARNASVATPTGARGGRRSGRSPSADRLPANIYEALLVDTNALQEEGRNLPLGARQAVYYREAIARKRRPSATLHVFQHHLPDVNAARFALTSRVMPWLVEALDITEVFHLALLKRSGDNAPLLVTGREADGSVSERGHEHLFVLPEDDDQDGRIDHVVLWAPVPFTHEVIRAVQTLRDLWTPEWWPGPSRHWKVYLEGLFQTQSRSAAHPPTPVLRASRTWVSATPYLRPWHTKRNGKFGSEAQIAKELRLRGLPEPVRVSSLEAIEIRGTRILPQRFRRLRYFKRQELPDVQGGFYEIEFPEPVQGPIALGSNCHFGMGMFVPRT